METIIVQLQSTDLKTKLSAIDCLCDKLNKGKGLLLLLLLLVLAYILILILILYLLMIWDCFNVLTLKLN